MSPFRNCYRWPIGNMNGETDACWKYEHCEPDKSNFSSFVISTKWLRRCVMCGCHLVVERIQSQVILDSGTVNDLLNFDQLSTSSERSKGPRQPPCGTPNEILRMWDLRLPRLTQHSLPVKYKRTQFYQSAERNLPTSQDDLWEYCDR